MKKVVVLVAMVILVGLAAFSLKQEASSAPSAVVVYPVSVDALLRIGEGIEEALPDEWEIQTLSAEGNPANFTSVADTAVASQADVIFAVGTQITNTILAPKYTGDVKKIIAVAISYPDLVLPNVSDQNITLVSDNIDTYQDELVHLVTSVSDTAKNVAVITNKGEPNSLAGANFVKASLEQAGIETIFVYVSTPAELRPSVQAALAKSVDMLVIPHDKIAVAQAAEIVRIAAGAEGGPIPVISLDEGTVKKSGVLAGLSANYFELGRTATDAISTERTAGAPPTVVYPEKIDIYVSSKAFESMGISIPESLPSINQIVVD